MHWYLSVDIICSEIIILLALRGAVFTYVVKKDFSYIAGNSYTAGKTHTHTQTKQNKTKETKPYTKKN